MYSMDLRGRAVKALDDGQSLSEVARRFEVSRPAVREWKQRAAAGRLEPDKSGPKGPRKYTPADDAVIHQALKHDPGVTARQVQPRLSQPVSIGSICGRMKKLGYRLKKKSLTAAEQRRIDVMRQRVNFALARRFVDPRRLVFLDESGAKTNMTRLYGRAMGGSRCHDATAHGHWKTLTMLSAIRLDGVVRDATQVFDGAMNAATFRGYVETCLAPSLRPGDVVIMDNLKAHKAAGVVEAIEAAGATVWYLPPYSPDLNPIEKLWSTVKTYLREVSASTVTGLIDAIGEALQTVDPAQCLNYFLSCGYGDKIMQPL